MLCTNLRGPTRVEALERHIGIPIHDSVATTLWGALRIAGVDAVRLGRWGRLFRDVT